jgi:hypothetical protein
LTGRSDPPTILRVAALAMQVDFEPGSQDPSQAFRHGMCDPNSVVDGFQVINQYIRSELSNCTIKGLANALHTIQDLFASGHRNCHPWHGGLPGLGHGIGDALAYDDISSACAASQIIVRKWMANCGKTCCD